MSWLSTKWNELSGKNQKYSEDTVSDEYDAAFLGARGTYDKVEQQGLDMMDRNSAFNRDERNRQFAGAADDSAEASRLAQRNIAMGGGGNATSTAFNVADQANNATAGAQQGAGMASGATNNLAQMNQTQMNAVSNQRQANKQIDSQATGLAANLLGKGASMYFGGMQNGGQVDSSFLSEAFKGMQDGGKVNMYQSGGYAESSYGNSGGMLSQVMGPDGVPMNIRTRIGGQLVGE